MMDDDGCDERDQRDAYAFTGCSFNLAYHDVLSENVIVTVAADCLLSY